MVGLLCASVSGVFFFYGKLQYHKGLVQCERNLARHRDDYAQFLARSYEHAFEHNSKNFKKSQEIYRKILNLPQPPHEQILKISHHSPCNNLGNDVVRLLNEFTKTDPSHSDQLRLLGSNASTP